MHPHQPRPLTLDGSRSQKGISQEREARDTLRRISGLRIPAEARKVRFVLETGLDDSVALRFKCSLEEFETFAAQDGLPELAEEREDAPAMIVEPDWWSLESDKSVRSGSMVLGETYRRWAVALSKSYATVLLLVHET